MTNQMGTPDSGGQSKPRNNTVIIIVVVVVLLCCCCAAAAAGYYLWTNGDALIQQFSRLAPQALALT